MKSTEIDQEELWHLLSELYLDQELDDSWLRHLAARLSLMPIDAPTLERVLFEEVHPVLHGNMLTTAGEWTGFDKTWLAAEIRAGLSGERAVTPARPEGFFARLLTRNREKVRSAHLRYTQEMVLPTWHRLRAHFLEERARHEA